MSEYHLIEKIDLYIQGELTGKELNSFQTELTNNPDLLSQVKLQEFTNEVIVEGKLDAVKQHLGGIHAKHLAGGNKMFSSVKVLSLISLVVLVSGGMLTYFMNSDSIEPIAKAENVKSEMVLSSREEIEANSIEEEEGTTDETLNNKENEETTSVNDLVELGDKEEETKSEDVVKAPEKVNLVGGDVGKSKKGEEAKPSLNKEEKSLPVTDNQDDQFQELLDLIKEEKEVEDPCAKVRISTKVDITPTCQGEDNGVLNISTEKTVGGQKPYKYSLDGHNYNMTGVFEQLGEGTYSFYIEDGQGCLNKLDNYIKVNSQACQK